jgi:protein ImuA
MPSMPETPFTLRQSRVHEVCGAAATSFAVALCARHMPGRFLWVAETWQGEVLNPVGLAPLIDPEMLLIARTRDQTDSLAVAEEALSDGALSVVVVNITQPLDLRAGRRLQLAAEKGQTIGLCLIPEGMGSNAAETRWRCMPVFDPVDSTRQRWELIKNKSGTLGAWDVRWDATTRRFDVVPPVGKRPGSEGVPD